MIKWMRLLLARKPKGPIIKPVAPQHSKDGNTVRRYLAKCICGRTFRARIASEANESLDNHIKMSNNTEEVIRHIIK